LAPVACDAGLLDFGQLPSERGYGLVPVDILLVLFGDTRLTDIPSDPLAVWGVVEMKIGKRRFALTTSPARYQTELRRAAHQNEGNILRETLEELTRVLRRLSIGLGKHGVGIDAKRREPCYGFVLPGDSHGDNLPRQPQKIPLTGWIEG
jgi:hypothetical protein